MLDTGTVSVWRSMLHNDEWHVRQEAQNVLCLAMNQNHCKPPLLCRVCTHGRTGGLRQQLFDAETVSLWRSRFYRGEWDVRQEALEVLGLAIDYSMRLLLC